MSESNEIRFGGTYNPRIGLTREILKEFFENVYKGSVSELSKETGLPYLLIYNLVHGRLKSLSLSHYRKIFGEEPSPGEIERVDADVFRDLVDLWLFFNDHITKADLYLEFYGWKHHKRVDYRLFSGKTGTVDACLENLMKKKFLDNGIDSVTLEKWMKEFKALKTGDRVPYETIRPHLMFLKYTLKINPTLILNKWFGRYESGELKSVPSGVFDKAVTLRNMAVKAIKSHRRSEIDRLREKIYGGKEHFTLYSEIEEKLKILQEYAGKSPRRYLGRSISAYEKGDVKHIAAWRAKRIRDDFDTFIASHPDVPIRLLPLSYRNAQLNMLLAVLKLYSMKKLFQHDGKVLEKKILTPLRNREAYNNGLIRFDLVSGFLGISNKAFDLMVAINCEIFRAIAIYRSKWYLPDQYVEELKHKAIFNLVAAKYEYMAEHNISSIPPGTCMN